MALGLNLNVRVCDYCGEIDSKPRHVHNVAPGELSAPKQAVYLAVLATAAPDAVKAAALASINDNTTQIRHITCCAKAGCPTGTCTL